MSKMANLKSLNLPEMISRIIYVADRKTLESQNQKKSKALQ